METLTITTTTEKIEIPVFQNVLDAIIYFNLNNTEAPTEPKPKQGRHVDRADPWRNARGCERPARAGLSFFN